MLGYRTTGSVLPDNGSLFSFKFILSLSSLLLSSPYLLRMNPVACQGTKEFYYYQGTTVPASQGMFSLRTKDFLARSIVFLSSRRYFASCPLDLSPEKEKRETETQWPTTNNNGGFYQGAPVRKLPVLVINHLSSAYHSLEKNRFSYV